MKKTIRLLCLILAMSMVAGGLLTACGSKDEKKPEDTGKKVVLINNTARDIDGVIYFKEKPDSKWKKVKSKSKVWVDGGEITLTLKGEVPKSEEGWSLKLKYLDTGETDVWTGVPVGESKAISIKPDSVIYPKEIK